MESLPDQRYRFSELQIYSDARGFWGQQVAVICRNNLRNGGSVISRMVSPPAKRHKPFKTRGFVARSGTPAAEDCAGFSA